jgi:hypothetical protein
MHKSRIQYRDTGLEGKSQVRHAPAFFVIRVDFGIRPLDVDDHIFPLIQALTGVPGSLKSWRGPVYDALNVFNSSWEAGKRWQPIINTLVDADRSIFAEILGQ